MSGYEPSVFILIGKIDRSDGFQVVFGTPLEFPNSILAKLACESHAESTLEWHKQAWGGMNEYGSNGNGFHYRIVDPRQYHYMDMSYRDSETPYRAGPEIYTASMKPVADAIHQARYHTDPFYRTKVDMQAAKEQATA